MLLFVLPSAFLLFVTAATVEPILSGQAARDYLAQAVNPTLLKGLTELCKRKPQCPVVGIYA